MCDFRLFISMLRFLMVCGLLCCQLLGYAQITTSSLSGLVTDGQENLPAATVIAIHESSGTRYTAVTNSRGYYQCQGMRPGGPYRVEISYVGYRKAIFTGIYLALGESYVCNAELEASLQLKEVVVKGGNPFFYDRKTGASTRIVAEDIRNLPKINRSLSDVLKLSPYATGNRFGGRDQRMNNISIDGANFNYNMGLDGAVLPGGGNPISIDALEEIQVNVAPYDVRLSNFIGGSVNAVTKSGTNEFRGTAYTFFRNERMRGNKVDGEDLGERPEEKRTIYGLSLGGPIVRNKLFFFVNGEFEDQPRPIHKWQLSTDGKEDAQRMISRVTESDMRRFSQDLSEMYGYNTGSWTDFCGGTEAWRMMARVDWNISEAHKLMIRYNNTSQQKTNNVVGGSLGIEGNPVSIYSMTFRNSTWKQIDRVSSLTAELNSRLGNRINNKLSASYTFNDANKRECNGEFPTVDIMKPDDAGDLKAFMNAGYDQHAWQNGITEKVWAVTDHVTVSAGNHTLMAGISFESQRVSNCYMRYGAGYYRYASYDDFVHKAAPVAFALTYSLTGEDRALAEVDYGQFSVYAQDAYDITPRLMLLLGVRMDVPFYMNERYENPSVSGYDFNGAAVNTARWPKAAPVFSPRIGFNYDVLGDNSLKLRGGTGFFNGRFPLVFLSKMQEGSGMLQNSVLITKASEAPELLEALAGGIRSREEILQEIAPRFPEYFALEPGAVNNIVTIDEHFKFPMVWKTSLAVDYELPLPFPASVTLEGMYIKDIHAVYQQDVNTIGLEDERMSRFSGADNRYRYPGNKEKRINEKINYAVLMKNTRKGYSYNLNAIVNLSPLPGLKIVGAYTYTQSKTLTNNVSNQVDNAWRQEPSVQGPNYQNLHNASYLISPHLVMAEASYTIRYAGAMSTMLSLYYRGEHPGNYSFLYSNDMNNDGINYDLMYIPRTREELNFQDQKVGNRVFTAEEQRTAFWDFVNANPYLRKHKGEYAEANGAYLPWLNRLDLRLMQRFQVKAGKTTNALELSVDIMNLGNLLNHSWGISKNISSSKLLQYKKVNADNEPVYTMNTIKEEGENVLPVAEFKSKYISDNCWQLQIGIRYIFN